MCLWSYPFTTHWSLRRRTIGMAPSRAAVEFICPGGGGGMGLSFPGFPMVAAGLMLRGGAVVVLLWALWGRSVIGASATHWWTSGWVALPPRSSWLVTAFEGRSPRVMRAADHVRLQGGPQQNPSVIPGSGIEGAQFSLLQGLQDNERNQPRIPTGAGWHMFPSARHDTWMSRLAS